MIMNLFLGLRIDMNLGAAGSFPRCDSNAAATAFVLDIFEAVNEIGNTWHQENKAESNSPQTEEHGLALHIWREDS
jgi:hypothetical protein